MEERREGEVSRENCSCLRAQSGGFGSGRGKGLVQEKRHRSARDGETEIGEHARVYSIAAKGLCGWGEFYRMSLKSPCRSGSAQRVSGGGLVTGPPRSSQVVPGPPSVNGTSKGMGGYLLPPRPDSSRVESPRVT